jgi:NADH:ubiquinone oxidoreductase subunit 3 (subunit A)
VLTDFGYIGLFLIVALAFAASMILIPLFLRFCGIIVTKPNPERTQPLNAGMETIGKTLVRFISATILCLDVYCPGCPGPFLYPWAVGLRQ